MYPFKDDTRYKYTNGSKPNQLTQIEDLGSSDNTAGDITNQGVNNYTYDKLGQLTDDVQADRKLVYDVTGKVVQIKRLSNNLTMVEYGYGAVGERVWKVGYEYSGSTVTAKNWTYYVGGNTYERREVAGQSSPTQLKEQSIAGAGGRIGVLYTQTSQYRYEISDHLGSVRVVISGTASARVIHKYSDYYPYGWELPGRSGENESNAYRYAYQGAYAEKDKETGYIAFELRQYEARIGRWLSYDPKGEFHSPYVGMGNDPINNTDPDGGSTDGPKDPPIVTFTRDIKANIPDNQYLIYQYRFIDNVNNVWGASGDPDMCKFLSDINWQVGIDGTTMTNLGEMNKQIIFTNSGDRSFVRGDIAFIRIQDMNPGSNTAAHEFGHFRGLADRYFESARWIDGVRMDPQRLTFPISFTDVNSTLHKKMQYDKQYRAGDNLYSNGSSTVTDYQVNVFLGRNKAEPSFQNGRGIFIHVQRDNTSMYRVIGGSKIVPACSNCPLSVQLTGDGSTPREVRKFIIEQNRF